MLEITADIYSLVAAHLREEIASADWFNGSVAGVGDAGDVGGAVEWSLTLTAIIYRRTETLPEGVRRPVSDVVPVWWEFHTSVANPSASAVAANGTEASAAPDPVSNNFSFKELKPYLIDYD